MKKLIRTAAAGFLLIPAFALLVSVVTPVVSSTSAQIQNGLNAANTGNGPTNLTGQDGVFTTVVNVLLFVIGAVSVIMLIYGGIRYTTSGGNANNVTAAKNTIMYAIIGLVVAIFAFAIVNWVVGAASNGKTS